MHRLFVTDALVLHKRGVGEANTLVSLLTKEYGLVRASARSARFERSKLRYGLETFTQGRFTMVRGRYEWKLTGVEATQKVFQTSTPTARRIAGRVSRLLLRLIQGEEPVSELFPTVEEGFHRLARAVAISDAEAIESILVLRMLALLGYLGEKSDMVRFVETKEFPQELLEEATQIRPRIIRTINECLGATGL